MSVIGVVVVVGFLYAVSLARRRDWSSPVLVAIGAALSVVAYALAVAYSAGSRDATFVASFEVHPVLLVLGAVLAFAAWCCGVRIGVSLRARDSEQSSAASRRRS